MTGALKTNIVAIIVLVLNSLAGRDVFSADGVTTTINVLLAIVALVGAFVHHKQTKPPAA